jgi:RNA-directed DNA polymerase
VNWILDADIAGFFDAVSHDWLIKFVELRVADRRVVRLIRKWLKAGVAEDGQVTPGEIGTPPASTGTGSRCGDLTTPGQHLPALRLRSVG